MSPVYRYCKDCGAGPFYDAAWSGHLDGCGCSGGYDTDSYDPLYDSDTAKMNDWIFETFFPEKFKCAAAKLIFCRGLCPRCASVSIYMAVDPQGDEIAKYCGFCLYDGDIEICFRRLTS